MVNQKMKTWGFNEGVDFDGLMPKVMDILGEENCIGVNEDQPSVHLYDPTANGYDQMEVVSPYDIMENE